MKRKGRKRGNEGRREGGKEGGGRTGARAERDKRNIVERTESNLKNLNFPTRIQLQF